jgi:membrane-associated phospholipid phosphatase
MKEKISNYAARFFAGAFNPLLVPTLGLLLIVGYMPGVEYFSFKLKLVILGVIFLSTCFIPLLFISLGNLNRAWNKGSNQYFDRVMPYLFIIMSTFLGSQFLGKLPIPGIFRIFLLGICITMIASSLIAFKWRVSDHTLALGGMWGAFLAFNFKFGMDLLWLIIGLILLSGVVGSSRIYLEKNSPPQVYAGFLAGMICMFIVVAFI